MFGVLTEPGHHTTVASLYGGPWEPNVPFEWIVVTVDFAGIFSRECVDSDYYDWRPWDVVSCYVLCMQCYRSKPLLVQCFLSVHTDFWPTKKGLVIDKGLVNHSEMPCTVEQMYRLW